jgi:hypothetical protein
VLDLKLVASLFAWGLFLGELAPERAVGSTRQHPLKECFGLFGQVPSVSPLPSALNVLALNKS